ncbi:7TM diverse intracellular signaling domain-containing protein [Deltaproteobacteria bacterium TL4]
MSFVSRRSTQPAIAYVRHGFLNGFLLMVTAVLLTGCGSPSKKEAPTAIQGVLDLSQWDFKQEGLIHLDGEWEFYWKQLLNADGVDPETPLSLDGFIKVPGIWNNFVKDGKKLGSNGFATYRLQVRLKEADQVYAFKTQDMGTAYQLWINGQPITSSGTVGKNKETAKAGVLRRVVTFRSQSNEMTLLLQISNFSYRKGGFWNTIHFGTEEQILLERDQQIAFDLFLMGSLLIMALYHLGLYVLRKKEVSTLYFGLFCLLTSIRTIVTEEHAASLFFPDLGYSLFTRTEYLTFYLGLPVFVLFIKALFTAECSFKFTRLSLGLGILYSLIVVLTPPDVYTHTLSSYQIISILSCIYLIYVLILARIRKREGATSFIAGFLIFFVTGVNDILNTQNLIYTGFWGSFGLFIFTFSQSFVLSLRFSKAFSMVEDLSENLEEKISLRTQELQESLQQTHLKEQELSRVNDIVQSVNSTLDLEDVIDFVTKGLNDLFKFDALAILIADETKENLHTHNVYGEVITEQHLRQYRSMPLSISKQDSLNTYVFRTRNPIYLEDIHCEMEMLPTDRTYYEILPFVSMLLLPLVVLDEVIGCLNFFGVSRPFNLIESDVDKIQNYVTHISTAICNSQMLDAIRSKELEAVYTNQLMQKANSTLDLEEVILVAKNAIRAIFEFDQTGILLVRDDFQALEVYKVYGTGVREEQRARLQNMRLPFQKDQSLFSEVVSKDEPVYFPCVTSEMFSKMSSMDQEFHEILKGKGYLLYPIKVQNKVLGVICFGNSKSALSLTKNNIETIHHYVIAIAGALHNAKLFETIQKSQQEIQFQQEQLSSLNSKLAKYLSPQLYHALFEGKKEVTLESARKQLTIFFAAIKGFTEATDHLETEVITELLNEYLHEMSEIVLAHGGTIDKYIGETIMGFFGDPETRGEREDSIACVKMAVNMREKMLELQKRWESKGLEELLNIRMGINSGYCTIGNFGTENRLEYTIMGSHVNLTKLFQYRADPGQILISQQVYLLVKEAFICEETEKLHAAGIAEPIPAYQVKGCQGAVAEQIQKSAKTTAGISLSLDLPKLSSLDAEDAAVWLERAIQDLQNVMYIEHLIEAHELKQSSSFSGLTLSLDFQELLKSRNHEDVLTWLEGVEKELQKVTVHQHLSQTTKGSLSQTQSVGYRLSINPSQLSLSDTQTAAQWLKEAIALLQES